MSLIAENAAILVSTLFGCWRIADPLGAALRTHSAGGRGLLEFGFPLYLNTIVNIGNERVSQYIVAAMGGPTAVAKYAVAGQLGNAGRRVLTSFTNVYMPIQTGHFAESKVEEAKLLASRSMLWCAFIVCSGTLAFAVLRFDLVELIFTDKYLSVTPVIIIFLIILLFRVLENLMGYFSVAAGYNYFPIKISLISSVFNIALTLVLFAQYGYVGAALAVMATQILMASLYYIWLRQAGLKLLISPVLSMLAFFAAALAWILLVEAPLLAAPAVPIFLATSVVLIPWCGAISFLPFNGLLPGVEGGSRHKASLIYDRTGSQDNTTLQLFFIRQHETLP